MASRGLKFIYVFLGLVVLGLAVAPLLTLSARLSSHPELFKLLWEPGTFNALRETLLSCLGSLFFSLVVSLPLAWWLCRTNVPYRNFFRRVLLFAYIVPPYLFAIAWVSLGVPRIGLLNRIAGTDWLNIYSLGGLIWVFSSAYLPIVLTTLSQGMDAIDPSLEEAARICGARPAKVFWKISLPCLFPTIASGSLLFLMAAMSAFGIPAIIGNPARRYVLTTKVYTLAKMGGLTGTDAAFVVSLWLLAFSFAFLLLNEKIRRKFQNRLTAGKAARPSVVDLGAKKWVVFGIVILITAILIVLPLLAVISSSFLRVAGYLKWENVTWDNYRYLFNMPETSRAILNSLWLAGVTGLICTAIGFLVAYFKDRTRLPFRNSLYKLATFPFAIPGTVLALGLLVSYGTGWGSFPSLALLGSPILMLIAYIAKDMAVSVQTLTPALSNIDPSLDEAGRICGASQIGVIRKILFPILLPALAGVFFLSALPALSELTMSVLLVGPGTETLGTLLFQLQDYANPQAACSLATLMLLFLATLMFLSRLFWKEGMKR